MDVLSYHCLSCGAALKFNGESQRWDCEFCHSSFVLGELEAAASAHESGHDHQTRASGETTPEHLQVYACPQCGAEIVSDDTTAATFCIYCQNPTIFPKQLEGEFRPALVLPFKTTKEQAVAEYQKLCKGKPLLPPMFTKQDRLEKITGVYVPYWLFDCNVHGSLMADARHITRWSDSKYDYTKTDYYMVERQGNMRFEQVPADGSKKMDDVLTEAIEPFGFRDLKDFQLAYLSGFLAERYDVSDRQVYPRIEGRVKNSAQEVLLGTVSGYTTVSVLNSGYDLGVDKAKLAMLPVWLLKSSYGGKEYYFAMNGQTGKMIGTLPISGKRAWAWFGGIFGALALILFIGGMFLC